jgi:hypothetical protein
MVRASLIPIDFAKLPSIVPVYPPTSHVSWQQLNLLGPNCPLWPLPVPCLAAPAFFGLFTFCHVWCYSKIDVANSQPKDRQNDGRAPATDSALS